MKTLVIFVLAITGCNCGGPILQESSNSPFYGIDYCDSIKKHLAAAEEKLKVAEYRIQIGINSNLPDYVEIYEMTRNHMQAEIDFVKKRLCTPSSNAPVNNSCLKLRYDLNFEDLEIVYIYEWIVDLTIKRDELEMNISQWYKKDSSIKENSPLNEEDLRKRIGEYNRKIDESLQTLRKYEQRFEEEKKKLEECEGIGQ